MKNIGGVDVKDSEISSEIHAALDGAKEVVNSLRILNCTREVVRAVDRVLHGRGITLISLIVKHSLVDVDPMKSLLCRSSKTIAKILFEEVRAPIARS